MSGPLSPDLLWMLTRSHTSFLLKRESGRIQFTKEPCNLTNINSFKYSGLANSKAVDIKSGAKGGIVFTKKHQKNKKDNNSSVLSKPSLTYKTIEVTNPAKLADFRRVAKTVRQTIGGHYRPDLVKPALARWTKYHASLALIKKKSGVAKKK